VRCVESPSGEDFNILAEIPGRCFALTQNIISIKIDLVQNRVDLHSTNMT
jgi:hypothetical protein